MSGEHILKQVTLTDRHAPTGFCRHTVYGNPMPRPAMLKIARFDQDKGYYLYYCGAEGREYTDTWHPTVEDALEQAKLEFHVRPEEWSDVA